MKKIILKNKLTNEELILEGNISTIPENWELVEEKNKKNGSVKKKANGDGSFYYSESLGKWIGQYGRKTITQRKNESKTDCKKRWEELKVNINNGTYIEKSNDTIFQIIQRYVKQKFKDGSVTARSYSRDLETIKQLEKTCDNFINKPIQKVTVEDIEDAKDKMREYSTRCIEKMWILLKVAFRIATSRRKISYNIMDDPDLKKPISKKIKKKIEALTVDEEKKLRNILNNEEEKHKYRDIILLQLNYGMRIGEVLARNLDDVDLKENTLLIWNTITQDEKYNIILSNHTKIYNKKLQFDKGVRTVPLDVKTKEIISKIKQSNLRNIHNLLFWDYKNNTFINPNSINSWLNRVNKKYNITNKKLTTHVLRHTKATRMREAGIPLPVIQYVLGQVEGSDVTDEVYTSVSLDFVSNELKKLE